VDVYDPGTGSQLHDLNPSDFHPTPPDLFWTTAIPKQNIDVQPGQGSATMQATNIPIYDYGEIGNALFGGGTRTPGVVSFKVVWSGVDERVSIRNTDPVYGGFAGNFVRNRAQMEWTAITDKYTFVSAPLSQSESAFAQIGEERNGSFFH